MGRCLGGLGGLGGSLETLRGLGGCFGFLGGCLGVLGSLGECLGGLFFKHFILFYLLAKCFNVLWQSWHLMAVDDIWLKYRAVVL